MNDSIGPRPGRLLLGARTRTALVVAVTAVAIGVTAFLIDRPAAAGGFTPSGITSGAPPQAGEKVPDFEARTPDGKTVKLSDFAGRPLWLSFGATWCPDCRAEAADVEAAYLANQAKNLAILTVWVNDDSTNVTTFAAKNGFTFAMVLDPDQRIADGYRLLGYPTHFFVDPEGIIQVVRLGRLTPDDMARSITEIAN
ncbi:MAG TPA: TlpA disulfide reductase family protein [Candidatus Limnocylindrales bacterium]|nr:TlpA disulfide reductase family protein [Candidatus Limnocylindrales bacterium]